MYSPQIHQEIVRQRQVEMRREAHRERVAAMAAAKPNGPGKLARIGRVLSSLVLARARVAQQGPAVVSAP